MIILIIILFIFILLLIGIKISLEYTKKGSELKGCLKILVFKKIKVYSYDFPSSDEEEDEDEDEEDEGIDLKEIFELIKPCFDDLKIFLKSLLESMSIKQIKNHLIFGMDSYADTGKYIGIIWAILSVVNSFDKNLYLSAEPSFNGSVLDGYGTNDFEIYPLKLVVPAMRLLSKKEIRSLIRGVLDAR